MSQLESTIRYVHKGVSVWQILPSHWRVVRYVDTLLNVCKTGEGVETYQESSVDMKYGKEM